MRKEKEPKVKMPMSAMKRILLGLLALAAAALVIYFTYYVVHYVLYDRYEDYLTDYTYEEGKAFTAVSEASSDVQGYALVAENDSLKLYTQTSTANVAVYDKRTGETTYSNPANADEDTVANGVNKNYLKSQFLVYYYNEDVTSGSLCSYADSVAKGQFTCESIEDGIRYIYTVGESSGIHFLIPLEYRLKEDSLEASIPVSAIEENGGGYVYRIQLLRYMGATSYDDEGYMLVPNGSGSLIYFNNGKNGQGNYSQYIYDIDPLAANYTTIENLETARLPIYAICKENSSLLVSVEDGASTALITAAVSGTDCDYNYAYPSFVLRVADNLRMFGDATQDVYVMEPDAYDVNLCTRYTFLTSENTGYSGVANYYRDRLISEGKLTKQETAGEDIPFYYDVIAGVKETSHILGIQYLHTFSMTDFDEAKEMSDTLSEAGITNQVMNLQGWFNGGYYHDAADRVKVLRKLGGKSGLEDLNEALAENGGRLYVDTAFQEVTAADDGFSSQNEASRYYGAGYTASFGLVNPTTLRNTSGLGYTENRYYLISPKYLPRYVEKFAKKINKIDVDGISLRDLGNVLTSDKKRTNQINREEALDVVLGQLDVLESTEKKLMTNAANDYAFAYSDDIINVPLSGSALSIIDADVPFYEMLLHGYVNYSSELLNFTDAYDTDETVLGLIEAGASPHYVFTWEDSSEMKLTALNRYYTTTYANWKDTATQVYMRVNEALAPVNGAAITEHAILTDEVRRITYDNGVVIYVNYGSKDATVDGVQIPALGYRMEGR